MNIKKKKNAAQFNGGGITKRNCCRQVTDQVSVVVLFYLGTEAGVGNDGAHAHMIQEQVGRQASRRKRRTEAILDFSR